MHESDHGSKDVAVRLSALINSAEGWTEALRSGTPEEVARLRETIGADCRSLRPMVATVPAIASLVDAIEGWPAGAHPAPEAVVEALEVLRDSLDSLYAQCLPHSQIAMIHDLTVHLIPDLLSIAEGRRRSRTIRTMLSRTVMSLDLVVDVFEKIAAGHTTVPTQSIALLRQLHARLARLQLTPHRRLPGSARQASRFALGTAIPMILEWCVVNLHRPA